MTDPLIATVLARTLYDDVQRDLLNPHRGNAVRQQRFRRLERRVARRRGVEELLRRRRRGWRTGRVERPALR